MNITELSLRRPTAIVMLVILFTALGVIGYTGIGADLLPSVNTPVISIVTTYPGASATEIENDIVKPVEDAVSGINGIDKIRSYAADGYGYTILQFKMSADTNTAVIDVQKALDGIADALPEDASRPVMRKYDINQEPILILSISGAPTYEELYNEADRIKTSLETLPGVGNVSLQGALKKELSVRMDKTALESYGVSINTVIAILKAQNINIPAGQIKRDTRDETVRILGEFQDVRDFRNLHIPLPGGSSVPLSELAEVTLKYPDDKALVRLDASPSIGIFVRKQSDANVVETANSVKKELEAVRPTLLPGVKLAIASDSTAFIDASLAETKRNLVEGIITTSIVLFLFLRRWRSSVIVMIAIPASLIATFFMMYVSKFTFNMVSLLGLAVCIGILVDDSVVVLENISRHSLIDRDLRTAVVNGRMEIGMAAVAITLCDVVVFAPVAFMKDIVGQFFKEFGLTVVFATLFSLFVSFTLTPMMSYFMYRKKGGLMSAGPSGSPGAGGANGPAGRFTRLFEETVKPKYRQILLWALDNRWKVIGAVAAGVAVSLLFIPLKLIETEFMPLFDQGKLVIDLTLDPGASLRQTDEKAKIVEKYLSGLPEVKDYFTTVGTDTTTSSCNIIVRLVEKNKRHKTQSALAREIRKWGGGLTGVNFSVTEQNLIQRTSIDGAKPVILNITGRDTGVLKDVSQKVESIVRSVRGVVDVDNSMRAGQSEIDVRIDRLAASSYGLTTYDVASVLRAALEGTKAGVYRKSGDEYDVVVKFRDGQVKSLDDISSVRITGQTGQQFFVGQVADISYSDSPQEIIRHNRQKAVTISANMQGRILGSINNEIRDKLKALKLPYGYRVEFGGDQRNMSDAFDSLVKAMIASILLVYMILVVLYESFLTPFIRMLSLPCGIIGALLALALTGKSLNVISLIGLIMLDGLVSKNGTLLVDYTNTLMKRGLPLREALVEAGTTRLRPIIMTSITMIVGMSPVAFSLGDGSELKSGMAVALIGGMITSTLMSPVLLPVVYTLIDDLRNLRRRKTRKTRGARGAGMQG